MKFKPINGYTKEKILEVFRNRPNRRSVIKKVCQYRGDDGLKCAVGEFIPDEVYDRRFEGHGMNEGSRNADFVKDIMPYMPLPLYAMKMLQAEHDCRIEHESTVNQRLIDWVNKNVR